MADDEPRAGELTTANYGWTKPNVGNSDDAWGGMINADLDGIDSVVHGIQTSIPTVPSASATAPAMDGTASAGSGAQWSRGDHVHPTDTTRYAASNPAGYVTAAGAAGAAPVQSVATKTGAVTLVHTDITDWTATLAPYALTTAIPGVATTTPLMDGTAAIGASGKWADGAHVHPTDTTRAAVSALASYLPLTGGTLTGNLTVGSGNAFIQSTGVSGGANPILQLSDTSAAGRGQFYWNSATNVVLVTNVVGGSNISLGADVTAAPASGHNFVVSPGIGYQTGGGSWGSLSDARIKTVEGEYAAGLDEVLQLNPVVYRYKGNDATTEGQPSVHQWAAEEGKPFVGLIAQEAETIFPGMVTKQAGWIDGEPVNDLRHMNTSELIFALVNAVKELTARVAELEAQSG